jgi:penicillin-binding protein 1C
VLDPAAAWIVSDVLADRTSRSLAFGLDNPLATRYWSAVKTGTSKDMRDNWCVGYSDRYTVGVWVGNFGGEPMRGVSGVSGAAPVWLAVMNALHEGQESRRPPRPDGAVAVEVAFAEGVEARRTEFFLAETEAPVVRMKHTSKVSPRITYPAAGAVIAFDPDIPAANQRVVLRMQPVVTGYRWRVNGTEIAARDGVGLWAPRAGRHRLDLVDSNGLPVDNAAFEVRGANRLAGR